MTDFQGVFTRLRAILEPYAPRLIVKEDTDRSYYLDTKHIMPTNKLPLFFACAAIKKQYVSFYLFSVYVEPRLLEGISPELRKRMQGKSCFNFKQIDEGLFAELAELTAAGARWYEERGYL